MVKILNIDTALETAAIYLAEDGNVIAQAENTLQKDHASWVHIALEKVLKEGSCRWQDLQSIAITAGPGSYTGIRVGMATAKGLCFALGIPLIMINTLRVLAATARDQDQSASWLCPLIDARRQEVFTGIYNRELAEQLLPKALILNSESFADFLHEQSVLFFGSGMPKWKKLCSSPNARFLEQNISTRSLPVLSFESFLGKKFSDLAYAEPFYLKEFHSTG